MSEFKGLIALVGSGEYLEVMEPVDRHLLAHCGADGRIPQVVCLPTAAGQEGDISIDRWVKMGLNHFHKLGAEVQAARITNRAEADDPHYAEMLAAADLIYFSGGNPSYLYQTLQGSRAWTAAESAWSRGAVYAGCSAGAMILARELPDLRGGADHGVAFGAVPARYVLPHFDRMQLMRPVLTPFLKSRLGPTDFLLGIDENTALVGLLGGSWQTMGAGKVYVFTHKEVKSYADGESVPLPA